jgi:hypothetical protein
MLKKIKDILFSKKIIEFLVFILIIISSIYFLLNIDFMEVPVSDTFQFIEDSQSYARFDLPYKIHASPANPILIALITPLLEVDFPAIRAATSISTISIILMLFFFFFFIKSHLKNSFLLLPAFIFLIFNSSLFRVVWDGNSDALFGFVALLSLITYEKNKNLAYMLSAFFILVRYEAVALLAAFFITDLLFYFINQKKKFNKKNILAIYHENWFKSAIKASLIIVFWFLFVHFHSWYNTKGSSHQHGNYYIYEVFSRIDSVPNWIFFIKFSNLFLNVDWWDVDGHYPLNSILSLFIFYLLIVSIIFSFKEKDRTVFTHIFFVIFYLLIHVFFPATNYRYLFAVLVSSIYFLSYAMDGLITRLDTKRLGSFLRTTTAVFFLVLTIYISKLSIKEVESFLKVVRNQGIELKKSFIWINQQQFRKKQYVLSFQVFNYFNLNDMVEYLNTDRNCMSVQCLLNEFKIEQDIWVIKNADSQRIDDFKLKEMSILIFNNNLEETCLTELFRVDVPKIYEWEDDNWAIIYNYDYEKCKDINLGDSY